MGLRVLLVVVFLPAVVAAGCGGGSADPCSGVDCSADARGDEGTTEDAPAEDAPAEDAPADDASAEDAAVDDALVEDGPGDDGGPPACGGSGCPCADGMSCVDGRDCLSRSCRGGACQPASCADGIKNGQECGVDCGGSCPAPCATERLLLDVFDGAAPCADPCSREVQGGDLELGGWTPLDGASRLIYDFGRHVDCGRLTVEVDNFDPWNQFQPRDLADPYTEFLSLFDGREDNPGDRFNHYSDYSQIDVVYPPACFDAADPTCTPNHSRIKPNTGLLTACDWDSGRYCADCLAPGTTHYVFELEWTVQGLTMRVNGVDQTYYAYPIYPNASCAFTCGSKTPELEYLFVGRPMMDWQGYLVGPVYRRVELEATVE